ncbi:uncharacterized protein BYT42DRAFT_575226 [Radiomyces spectabilis]|uniref:uncharacterized protein n=1 Tax=Radiomyces spectabilis TaxID=64574 RepID=UPI0022201BB6|nr:uncharacterized protein BYT42DRAFT_575226 [Radiomyces spectabilis]KAI8374126.1 hypothetical protein BYT42DRAFT_575226 [Radiomyces spectabilis]
MKMGLSKRTLTVFVLCAISLLLIPLLLVSNGGSSQSSTVLSSWRLEKDRARSSDSSSQPGCLANTAKIKGISVSKTQWEQCLDPGSGPSYYLSIVIVTRMDDYAGNQHHRFQNFIDSAYLLAEHTKEKIELLIVEWNPPNDHRRVIDAFRFRRSQYLTYRIISVPEKIHKVLPNRGNSPLHEFEGKNVGIRFARGEFIVCTNQDDIWSHNFHNAIKSRVFQKGIIYLQFQDRHNIHDNLPPSIVRLPPFPDDDTLYNSCRLHEQDWGNFELPEPTKVTTDNILRIADQAGDFTMAHRDTWKIPRGYREAGGIAWMDIEFICTAAWTFDIPVVYSERSFACHQEHPNIWESLTDQKNDNKNIDMGEIMRKEKSYMNKEGEWALEHIDIWELDLECIQFRGGLCW